MSGQHAGPPHTPTDGECVWTFHHEDVDLYCDNRAIPAAPADPTPALCADHLIQHVHTVRPWRRWFGDPT